MKERNIIKKIKIVTLAIVATQLFMFFLPINLINSQMVSFFEIWKRLLNEQWLDQQSVKLFVMTILSTITLLSNIVCSTILFFVKTPNKHRTIALTSFLSSGVVYAFCWGAMIDMQTFLSTLYGFYFIALVLTITVITTTLFINETQVAKKEL